MIDRTLASTLAEGSISALNYANRLNQFVMGMFIMTIGTVIYPILSKLSNKNNNEKFIESVVKSINSVVLLVIPISVGAMVLASPIVKILFQRGEFGSRANIYDVYSTFYVFYRYGCIGLRDILGKIFYALQDTKTPMVNGVVTIVMNIVLNIVFVKIMGHAGLAFATSISAIICIFLLFNSLKKKIGYFGQDKILKTTIKSLISSIVMGVVTYFIYNTFSKILGVGFIQEVLALFGSIAIGSIIYGLLIIVLKVEEVNIINNMIKRYTRINIAKRKIRR